MENPVSTESIESLIGSLNSTIDDMRSASASAKVGPVPSTMKILLSGANNSKAVDFLFSTHLDSLLEGLFDAIISGNFDKVIASDEQIKKVFAMVGLGEGSFEGEISQRVITSIMASTNSVKFNNVKSKARKAYLVVRNLEKQTRTIKDPVQKKKYKDSVYALKRVLRYANRIYRNRKLINARVIKGLNNVVHEDVTDDIIILERIA